MGPDSAPSQLPVPVTAAGRAGLDALLADLSHALVAADFDGTLSPIVADPGAARAHPGAAGALARLAPLLGTFAVITGRPAGVAADRAGLVAMTGVPHLVVLGAYGAERWDSASGEVRTPPPHPGVDAVRAALPALLAGEDPGVHVEDKGRALAVHTRRANAPAQTLDRLRPALEDLAARHGLAVEPGRLVVELRPPGADKGRALTELARATGARAVLYAGDDLGDLAAFDAVEALRAEGVPGVLVCSGSDEVSEVAARADVVVDGPGGVVDLLDALAAAAGA
jgi:trehalose 6-phosphate phosphatase